MKIGRYIADKMYAFIIGGFSYLVILLMMFGFKVDKSLIIAVSIVMFISAILVLIIDIARKKKFYDELVSNTEGLDKKYLVLETIKKPHFYEGELLYDSLYDIDKSMAETVNQYKISIDDFKDYIEMWIHEIKIPISNLTLIMHNHYHDSRVTNQIKRIEQYTEQVLYYVRSENVHKDYLINNVNLNKVVSSVAINNKDSILENNIEFSVNGCDKVVLTDAKWLEFILNQIMSNSIKYKKDKQSKIAISAEEQEDKIILSVHDNGIGIKESDLPKVFEKSFTGYNGRVKSKSTGMGLYIAKQLCTQLGHKIKIESKINEFTKVSIIFKKNNYYDVVR